MSQRDGWCPVVLFIRGHVIIRKPQNFLSFDRSWAFPFSFGLRVSDFLAFIRTPERRRFKPTNVRANCREQFIGVGLVKPAKDPFPPVSQTAARVVTTVFEQRIEGAPPLAIIALV